MDMNPNTPAPSDADMEEHEGRSEATFKYTVQDFSKLKNAFFSPPFYIKNLPWKFMLKRHRKCQRCKHHLKGSLEFFLQCDGDSKSSSWSCNVEAELRLLSVRPDVEPFSRKIRHLFNRKQSDMGYFHFMAWDDVLDPKKGYMEDDAIIVEVHAIAGVPRHGVSCDNNKLRATSSTITMPAKRTRNEEILPILNVSDNTEANTLKLLNEAIQKNSLDGIKELPINRININSSDDKGNTPLQYAIMSENIEILEYLMDSEVNVCKRGENGKTPLQIAVEIRNLNIIKFLMARGAKDTIQSAFLQAVTLQNLDVVCFLLEYGVLLDVNYKDGHTPLTKSVEINNLDIVKVLIEHGADVNMPKSDGTSALSLTLKTGNFEIYSYLINNNAQLSMNSDDASKYLLKYIEANDRAMVQRLVALGAKVDAIYECGDTPLTKAASLEKFEMVKYLIENGANVNQSNRNGKVPLGVAAANKDIRIVKFLIQSQACLDLAKEEIEEFVNFDEDFDIFFKMLKRNNDSCGNNSRMNSFGGFDQEATL